jgi:hypothetical protein
LKDKHVSEVFPQYFTQPPTFSKSGSAGASDIVEHVRKVKWSAPKKAGGDGERRGRARDGRDDKSEGNGGILSVCSIQ